MQLVNRQFLNQFKNIIIQSHEKIVTNLSEGIGEYQLSPTNVLQKIIRYVKSMFQKPENR